MKTLNSPQYMINANEDPLLSIEQENVYTLPNSNMEAENQNMFY